MNHRPLKKKLVPNRNRIHSQVSTSSPKDIFSALTVYWVSFSRISPSVWCCWRATAGKGTIWRIEGWELLSTLIARLLLSLPSAPRTTIKVGLLGGVDDACRATTTRWVAYAYQKLVFLFVHCFSTDSVTSLRCLIGAIRTFASGLGGHLFQAFWNIWWWFVHRMLAASIGLKHNLIQTEQRGNNLILLHFSVPLERYVLNVALGKDYSVSNVLKIAANVTARSRLWHFGKQQRKTTEWPHYSGKAFIGNLLLQVFYEWVGVKW